MCYYAIAHREVTSTKDPDDDPPQNWFDILFIITGFVLVILATFR